MKISISNSSPNSVITYHNTIYLKIDNWDDYSFKTTFEIYIYDSLGKKHNIGIVKIGFFTQKEGQRTSQYLLNQAHNGVYDEGLPLETFSLGVSDDYYKNMMKLPTIVRTEALKNLNDIVFNQEKIKDVIDENVFKSSLLRGVSISEIKGNFKRILEGGIESTDYSFTFYRQQDEKLGEIELSFNIKAHSKPPTNIHILIGRNGIGKTTLLNNMIEAITNNNSSKSQFFNNEYFSRNLIDVNYFSRLISVSFSVFDKFSLEEIDRTSNTNYYYIGIKKSVDVVKNRKNLNEDFIKAYNECLINQKIQLLSECIHNLEADENFAEINLFENLTQVEGKDSELIEIFDSLSSGHAIVLLTITQLVAKVGEKTLVIMDEPEGHLHPPLLSAFIRTLSDILYKNNGVAIIATHSPVVIQEVPKDCVWKIKRFGQIYDVKRPNRETFGENVGILTKEVFGLEVERTGFYNLIKTSVEEGKSYENILMEYENKLGMEAQLILRSLLKNKA